MQIAMVTAPVLAAPNSREAASYETKLLFFLAVRNKSHCNTRTIERLTFTLRFRNPSSGFVVQSLNHRAAPTDPPQRHTTQPTPIRHLPSRIPFPARDILTAATNVRIIIKRANINVRIIIKRANIPLSSLDSYNIPALACIEHCLTPYLPLRHLTLFLKAIHLSRETNDACGLLLL